MRFSLDATRSSVNDSWMGSWHNAVMLPIVLIGGVLADHLDNPTASAGVIAFIAAASLLAWRANHRRYRLIHDTPASNIRGR